MATGASAGAVQHPVLNVGGLPQAAGPASQEPQWARTRIFLHLNPLHGQDVSVGDWKQNEGQLELPDAEEETSVYFPGSLNAGC